MIKVLNLGCGKDNYGTHRIDFQKSSQANIIHDLSNPLPFSDNYFDEVRIYRTFEHLRNCGLIVDEIYRVLKKGGHFDLITDNAGYIVFHTKSEHNSYLFVKGYNKHPKDIHRYLFVPSHLKAHFNKFRNLRTSYLIRNNKKGWKLWLLKWLPFHLGWEEIRLRGKK